MSDMWFGQILVVITSLGKKSYCFLQENLQILNLVTVRTEHLFLENK